MKTEEGPVLARVVCAALLLALIPWRADADDAAPAGRSPGDMTVEERTAMMKGVADYNGCVYRESMARVEKLPDIRQAADEGMAACEEILNTLRELIEGYGFEAGFGEQFTHHAQSRAARSVLPELALRKGNP